MVDLKEQIEKKKAEITHYEGVLERYGSGRWMNMGRAHMKELREELKELEKQLDNPSEQE